jgi:D-alanyl-D-alanine carboxypeptidase
MRGMRRTGLVTAIAVILIAFGAAWAAAPDRLAPGDLITAPPVAAALATLDREIAADLAARAIPGAAIVILYGHDILWRHDYGFADLAHSTPVDAATRFRLGSISKLLTAIAVVRLRDQGKLSLDDPVTRHLPWFRLAGDEQPRITLRELLLHLAGLPREAPGASWTDQIMPSRAALIAALPATEPAIPAETSWKYSNLGYALLGLVIEAASGQSYADYLDSDVLAPLGMTDTLVEPQANSPGLAIGYGARDGSGARPARDFLEMGALTPAAGLAATAADLAKLAAWALETDDKGPLSAESRREMLRVQAEIPDFSGGQGLGWETRRIGTVTRIGHAGKAAGFAAKLTIEPASRLGIVVLSNADENGPGKWADRALDLLAPALAASLPPPPAPIPDAHWQDYVGSYGTDQRNANILILDGRLAWQDAAGNRILLEPAGPDRFKWLSGGLVGEAVVFERDPTGRVARMIEGGYYDMRR